MRLHAQAIHTISDDGRVSARDHSADLSGDAFPHSRRNERLLVLAGHRFMVLLFTGLRDKAIRSNRSNGILESQCHLDWWLYSSASYTIKT